MCKRDYSTAICTEIKGQFKISIENKGLIKRVNSQAESFARKNWQLINIRYNQSMRYALAIFLMLFSLPGFSSPAEERPDNRISFLDRAQDFFGARANFTANRLDSFFATERADDEFGRSRIRIRSRFDLRERAKSDLNNQYRINLKLPHLEEKFRWDYYQDKDEKEVTKEDVKQRISESKINKGWIFNSDIGVVAALPPKLVTRARVRRNVETGELIHRFSEQLTYITDESGLTEETSVDSDYSFNDDLLLRFVNYKQWQVLKKDFRTNHGPTLLHRVSEDDAFNYGVTMSTTIDNGRWFVDNYRLSLDYRRNLYQQWIYLDVIPGIDFPKVWSFRRTPFISFQLEVLFGS